jgi:tetratricopeptide (TPR) repeat protein
MFQKIPKFASLARGYGNLAYVSMMSGRLSDASKFYQKAITHCKDGNLPIERSAFQNDLSFVYARLGKFNRARAIWVKAYSLRQKDLHEYHIGLSENVAGLIDYLDDRPFEGEKHVKEALKIFTNIDDQRGVGLALRALGALQARKAHILNDEKEIEDAKRNLKEAIKIFKPGSKNHEKSHYADSLEKLSLLYFHEYEIGKTLGKDEKILKDCLIKSEETLNHCIEQFKRAYSDLNLATAHCRLGKVYFAQNKIKKAKNEIEEMENILTNTEDSLPEKLFHNVAIRKEPIEDITLKLSRPELLYPTGKLERAKARLEYHSFFQDRNKNPKNSIFSLKKAAESYTKAYVLLHLYSPQSFASKEILNEIPKRLEPLTNKETDTFVDEVKHTQIKFGLDRFSAINERIYDLQIYT